MTIRDTAFSYVATANLFSRISTKTNVKVALLQAQNFRLKKIIKAHSQKRTIQSSPLNEIPHLVHKSNTKEVKKTTYLSKSEILFNSALKMNYF